MHWQSSKFVPDNPSPLSVPITNAKARPPARGSVEDAALAADQQSPGLPKPSLDHHADDTAVASAPTSPHAATDSDCPLTSTASFINNTVDLTEFPLFKKAPQAFLNRILANLQLLQYNPQDFIIKKGDPSKSMYWILKGNVYITSADGDSIYNELTSGQFFGEIGILFNRPRTANVIAKTKVLVGVLTSQSFNVVLRSFPPMERRIRDEAQERLAMLDKKAAKSSKIPPITTPVMQNGSHDKLDSTISIQQFLQNLAFFQNLPPHIIHKIALGVEPMHLKPFEHIFYENDFGSDLYLIVDGQVEVLKYNPSTKIDKIIAKLNSGNYFGEMSFLSFLFNDRTITKRAATIRSITNLELIVIRSDFLKELCDEYPFLIEHMKKTSEKRNHLNNLSKYPISYLLNTSSEEATNNRTVSDEAFSAPHSLLSSRSASPDFDSLDISPSTSQASSMIFKFQGDYRKRGVAQETVRPVAPGTGTPPVSRSPVIDPLSMPAPTPIPSLNLRKRSVSINLTPPLNPQQNVNGFQVSQSDFDFVPRNKRLKLHNLNPVRRRSSVLANNGPLSDKILVRVFEFLDLPTLMKFRVINRRWRQLLYVAPNLCTRLDLTPWNASITDSVLIDITKFVGSRPTYIDISNCFHITDEGFTYMVNEIGISGRIEVLKMRSNWEISAMAIMDLSVPSVGQYLQEIDLSNCRKVRDVVVERLIGWSSSSPAQNADELDVIPEVEYEEDIGCKSLTKLNIGYCKHLTDNIMLHIANNCNARLTELNLTRCTTITDKGFEFWTYKVFPNLTKLSLKDCTFLTDKSIISIANSVPNLEWLDLNFCCSLTDIAIEVLCIGCHHLKFLDLSFCGSAVSDSSLLAISENLRELERLILKGCIRVTRAGIDSLLSGVSPLTYLNVSQCKNSDVYPGSIPAQKLKLNPETKSAFVTAGTSQKIIEIVM